MERSELDAAAPFTSVDSSPRSTLGWKDAWGYESGGGLDSLRFKSFPGLSSDKPDGPKTPPLQVERKHFRSKSPPSDSEQGVIRSLQFHTSSSGTEASATPESTLEALKADADERRRRSPPSQVWQTVWSKGRVSDDSPPPFSRTSSSGFPLARDDKNSFSTAGDDTWSVGPSVSSPAMVTHRGERTSTSSNRVPFVASLSDELKSIKACVKRAIDLGKKVQHYGAREVSQLKGEKASAEKLVQKSVEINRELAQQVSALREEVQKLQWEREMEVMATNNEIQELEMERNALAKAASDEKKKREVLQSEIDSVLSVLLEEKMELESEREANEAALREEMMKLQSEREANEAALREEMMKLESEREANLTGLRTERKKVQAMKKARDVAVQELEDGTRKLDVERDTMLIAMRDLTSRLDLERDDKLRSMRRSSMDMAAMMGNFRLTGKKKSMALNDQTPPMSRSLSRQGSRQL